MAHGPYSWIPVKGDTRTAVDMLIDIFKNVSAKDKAEVDKQHSRMGAAAEEHTTSNQAEEIGIWVEPDEAELADDDLCTTKQVEIRHSGNHLSSMENGNFGGQEKVNPDATLGPKPKGPTLIEDDNPRPRRLPRRQ